MNAPSALSVSALSKTFGGPPVLDELSLEVPAGSLTAVLGPSGCGKTTLLRLIAGFERADAGTIRVGERVVCDARTHVAPEDRGIGFVAQEGALFPHLDVAANVGFGLPRARRRSGRVEELLELVGLGGLAGRYPHELSGGQQQRVALARALAPSPGLVLLDEPFDALDASLRAEVRAEVRAALRESGATALLVTHDQEEALSLADVVAVMRDGRIAQAADPQALYRDPVDAELAGFLGEAVLLSGRLRDDHAETALGRLATRGGPSGNGSRADAPVTVMLRPEQILCREPTAGSPLGRVLATQFFGHDATALISLEDPSCPQITARAAGHRLPQVGEQVSVVVEGTALAYPSL
jgi:iron(III) transport system ATP-binding protein